MFISAPWTHFRLSSSSDSCSASPRAASKPHSGLYHYSTVGDDGNENDATRTINHAKQLVCSFGFSVPSQAQTPLHISSNSR
ncbi:hypothetical protein Q7C36_006533 [Tachysurus vachellii]|uniref:Uncharacterized protein n=1 Tax=Tachysurus vachellii TaxID=175792 RepID=A0AA88NJI7_TACVA|nr:hypothetical protein Q7C36_006533 [Tachysurus vachellii]